MHWLILGATLIDYEFGSGESSVLITGVIVALVYMVFEKVLRVR